MAVFEEHNHEESVELKNKEKSIRESLSLLGSGSDEEKIVALLLLARCEDEFKKDKRLAIETAQTVIKNRFLERLLKTKDESIISDSQHAGLAVILALASSCSEAMQIFSRSENLVIAIIEITETCLEIKAWNDLASCLTCLETLDRIKSINSSLFAEILAECSVNDGEDYEMTPEIQQVWQLALRHVSVPTSVGALEKLLEAATKQNQAQALLLELCVAAWTPSSHDAGLRWASIRRSSQARQLRETTLHSVVHALPRLLILPQNREPVLRLASLTAETFGLVHFDSIATIQLLANLFAAESRLALDQALAIFDDSNLEMNTRQDEMIRLVDFIPLGLNFLIQLIDTLLGVSNHTNEHDSSNSDSDDEPTLADKLDPDTILAIRYNLLDAADAALTFTHHIYLSWKANNDKSTSEIILNLCRELFRFLGRLVLELDEDDISSSIEEDPSARLDIHSRLSELRPFVNYLMALDAAAANKFT
uniref:Neurochondrin n=1 Tax=Aureoumbra lagunensis TaxID=44058 RepID=A0A7S3NI82_9STRA|mmetsp:Transcript_7040/g.8464  ORF Transcript_7040/g.8464 Transcript_7040/m.8464 type:complete len:481 (-) Transcript_7040:456-1898(-)